MSKPIEGKSAFPSDRLGMTGLSERRYYIGQALAGYCASHQYCGSEYEQLAKIAIQQADAVMSILYPQSEKEPNQ